MHVGSVTINFVEIANAASILFGIYMAYRSQRKQRKHYPKHNGSDSTVYMLVQKPKDPPRDVVNPNQGVEP